MALVLIVAAVRLEPVLAHTALFAYLLANVPHTVFHLTHVGGLPMGDALTQNIGLVVVSVVAGFLLLLTRRPVTR